MLVLLSLAAAKPVLADDLTGMMHDDPKDLLPPTAQEAPSSPSYNTGFLPLPSWARGATMPPLPQALKPMGKKVVVLTTPPVAAPQSLTPPRDQTTSTVTVARTTPVSPTPAAQTPAMIAVSPFLEWIKANPQAAAEQARQQAGTYAAGSDANAAVPPTTGAAASNNSNAPVAGTTMAPPSAPYWLPPLIDAAPFGTSSSPGGSSAAIYSTPQRYLP